MKPETIILGGGPAGSSASILLAKAGYPVTVIEKESFPRFHIGESLLPSANRSFRRLGIFDDIHDAGFLEKRGAEFTVPTRQKEVINQFADGMQDDLHSAFQVERAHFDQILLNCAHKAGAAIEQPARVVEIESRPGGGWIVTYQRGDQTLQKEASYLIDASGRNRMLGKHLKLSAESLPYPKRVATFAHYRGFPHRSGERAGNIEITRISNGWIWMIPLANDCTSIGWVTGLDTWKQEKGSPEERLDQTLDSIPWLHKKLAKATRRGPVRMESDYSYSYQNFAGIDYFLTGDAACFIDPIFSSGVAFALESGIAAADAILGQGPGRSKISTGAQKAYNRRFQRGVRTMRKLTDLFYSDEGFAILMNPNDSLGLVRAFNSVVAGEVRPPLRIKWRLWIVLTICRLNRRYHFVPTPPIAPVKPMPQTHRS
ncbi:MAG: NAD(P)/FAD-dependent oxidoreductase [Puniceicoccales bacterium]